MQSPLLIKETEVIPVKTLGSDMGMRERGNHGNRHGEEGLA